MLFILLAALLNCPHMRLPLNSHKQVQSKTMLMKLPSPDYKLIWSDEFNDTAINTKNWVIASLKDSITGDMVPGATGTNLLNSEYAGYITREDTYIENGSLILRNQKRTYTGTDPEGTYNYTSGWIMSMHRMYLNKGYIEIRAKMPSGDKVWPAFWLVSEDLVWGPEWDLFEYLGYRNDQGYDAMGMHLMTGKSPTTKWYSYFSKPFDASSDCESWHVYGFEWTKTFAKWYIDGHVVRTLNASSVPNWPNENMYLILNNGERTSSPDTSTTWPNTVEVDYVRIYQKASKSDLAKDQIIKTN